MSNEQVRLYFQIIRQQTAALQRENVEAWQELNAALEALQGIYEQMRTDLEAAEAAEEGLLEENQYIAAGCQHYYELFQFSPVAYLVTDAEGGILEANQAIAQLLNVSQPDLIGTPLILYVVESDRGNVSNLLLIFLKGSRSEPFKKIKKRSSTAPAIAST
jgi:PAS domain-containing protein